MFYDFKLFLGNLMCGLSSSARSYRDDSSDRSEVSGASFASNRTYLESIHKEQFWLHWTWDNIGGGNVGSYCHCPYSFDG